MEVSRGNSKLPDRICFCFCFTTTSGMSIQLRHYHSLSSPLPFENFLSWLKSFIQHNSEVLCCFRGGQVALNLCKLMDSANYEKFLLWLEGKTLMGNKASQMFKRDIFGENILIYHTGGYYLLDIKYYPALFAFSILHQDRFWNAADLKHVGSCDSCSDTIFTDGEQVKAISGSDAICLGTNEWFCTDCVIRSPDKK